MLRKIWLCLGAAALCAPVTLAAQDYDAQVRGYLTAAASDMVGNGYRLQGNMHTGSLDEDERTEIRLTLGAGEYVIMGACDEDCDDVDLFLYQGGEQIASDLELDDFPSLEVNLTGGSYTITVSMFGCDVEPCWYAVGVYRRGGGSNVARYAANGGAGVFADISYSGGSSEWDDVVKQIMLERFDHDRSGWIDRDTEVQAIPCPVLQSMDSAIMSGEYSSGLTTLYGFRKDMSWLGNLLGFHENVRASAFGRMLACGLRN